MLLVLDGMNVDSLTKMIKMSFSWENWSAILEISEKLFELTAIIYDSSQHHLGKVPLKRSMAYYFGYSLCMKGIAFQKLGRLSEARVCVSQYSDLSWIKDLDDDGIREVEFYRTISKANNYVLDLLEGKNEVLREYIDFIRNSDKEELLAGLITVLESAIKHHYCIDWILDEFKDEVEKLNFNDKRENVRYYVDYMYLHVIYRYNKGSVPEAINLVLHMLDISSDLDDEAGFRKSVSFFESLKEQASTSQKAKYQAVMKNMYGIAD